MRDVVTVENDRRRVSQQLFYFGRTVLWQRDRPGWFVALTDRDETGQLLAVQFQLLTPEEEELLKSLYPSHWGQLGSVVLAPPRRSRLWRLLERLWRRAETVPVVVEFLALYYDPHMHSVGSGTATAHGVAAHQVGV